MRTALWVGVVVAAAGLAGVGPLPVAAQAACQQIQIKTTRVTSPITVTALDAIAFPVQPAPVTSVVVRQIVVCPPGSALPPAVTPIPPVLPAFPGVVGAPVVAAPVVTAPAYVVTPVIGQPSAPAPPPPPAVVGVVPVDTVRDLATRSDEYDRMLVTVTGTAADVQQTTDLGGRPITVFRLDDQGASVGVVIRGHPALLAGDQVRVTGSFCLATPFVGPSGRSWHNVIDAETLER